MSEIYALDLDEDLLSHLPDPDAWVVINGEGITTDLIEDDFVAEVFRWQRLHIREHSKPATGSVLEDQFEDLELATPETAIGDLLDRLRERYARNQQRDALREIIDVQQSDPVAVPQVLLRKGRELNALLAKRGEVYGTGDLDRAMRRYDLKVQSGPGASFGHEDLDEYFYGMKGLNFWIAPPKTYKSWQMVQGTADNALAGKCAWLYALELPAEETDMRLRCLLAEVPWWHYTRNCISKDERQRIQEASEIVDGSGTYRVVKPPAGQRSIEEMIYKARDGGADVIFIDQLQYIEVQSGSDTNLGGENKTGEYWKVLNRARDLSDDGPICIAHQFNRSTMHSDKMPSMEQIKGSSAVEETATLALGMWANKDMRQSGIIEVGTLVARNHMFAAWHMEVELNHSCSFAITGRAPEEDEA